MADQFRKGVSLRRLERFGLDDQVAVSRAARSRNQVDANRCSGRAVVSRGEFVDDCLHAVRRVLRCLSVLRGLGGDDVTDRNGHGYSPSNCATRARSDCSSFTSIGTNFE